MAGGNWYGDELMARYRKAAMAGITEGIGIIDAEAVRLIMSGPKTGRVYTTRFFTRGSGAGRVVIPYGSRPPHQASAPGEAPASDLGFLVNNRSIKLDEPNLTAALAFHAAYALMLEKGTDKIEPRPFAVPALVNSWPAVVKAIRDHIKAPAQ